MTLPQRSGLAGEHRDKLIALIGLWYAEAGKYDVLPVDGSGIARVMTEKPLAAKPRDRYVCLPNTQSVPSPQAQGAQPAGDGTLVAEAKAPVTTPFLLNPGALTCGANPGSPVTPDYPSPYRFTGTLHSVTVDVLGELIVDSESELLVAMVRQ